MARGAKHGGGPDTLRWALFLVAAISAVFLVAHMRSGAMLNPHSSSSGELPPRRGLLANVASLPDRLSAAPGIRVSVTYAPNSNRSNPQSDMLANLTRSSGAAAAATAVASDLCFTAPHVEYEGSVAMWGDGNVMPSAAACCDACRAHRLKADASGSGQGCLLWVWCARPEGCAGKQKAGACWGKRLDGAGGGAVRVRARGPDVQWTSGAVFTEQRAAAAEKEARRTRPGNPRVFFDISINGAPSGRIEFILYVHESPRHAENFRCNFLFFLE
ncbi:hypothetical protein T492DRAFT_1126136 [Pavlovales sp. CCMP2436]|nr:hypothetical protein T492DRAFT_1126136 [Pavlovales sp. CCMP2436]